MTSTKDTLLNSLRDHSARIGILGLGDVGLPLATAFGEAGFHVVRIYPDPRKINALNNGASYVQDVSGEQITRLFKNGRLSATADFSELLNCDAVSICVPTPLRKTGDPDMSFILSATEQLAKYIHPGMIIVLESTTYPGTTREVVLPKLTGPADLTG